MEKMVRARLAEITPGWPVLGEEAGGREDNISTAPGRSGWWTLSMAPVRLSADCPPGVSAWGWITAERAEFGVIEIPMTGEQFFTQIPAEKECYLNGRECPPEQPGEIDSESMLYVPSDSHRAYRIDFPGKVRALGSAAYHGLLAGTGRTTGVLHGEGCIYGMQRRLHGDSHGPGASGSGTWIGNADWPD